MSNTSINENQRHGARPFKIGLMLPQIEGMRGSGIRRWTDIKAMAQVAEDVGFDSLWITDHFLYRLQGEQRPRGVWECWSLLAALAACTQRVSLGTLVLGMGFRNPALLAKMADAVEEISGGRLILGVGAGYHELEYRAFGYPFDHRYSRFEEAIQILHGLLKRGAIDFQGKYYSARDCELIPRGPRPAGPPLMIGTIGTKMLGLVANYADAWNAYYDDTRNSVDSVPALRRRVDEACQKFGRAPTTLERTVTALVADASADPWWTRLPTNHDNQAIVPLSGAPERIATELLAYAREGISHVQICLEPTTCASIEAFARVFEALDQY